MIFNKQFDQITKADIDTLISSQVPEGRELDYKEKLPNNTLDEKREYLYDLTSFANTSGGLLIFGIQEQRDANDKPMGVPAGAPGLGSVNADKEIQRLESFQLTGIERRVLNVRIKTIEGFANGPVILVQIPKSLAAPHMVTLGGIHRFYARNERGKYLMDWHEIQSSFLLSDSISEKIRNFRLDRVARIEAGEDLPTILQGQAKAVLHMASPSAFQAGASVDVVSIKNDQNRPLRPLSCESFSQGDWDFRLNIDGFFTALKPCSYVLLLRSGQIESVDSKFLAEGAIPFPQFEFEVARSTKSYLNVLNRLGVSPPIFVMITLLNVRRMKFIREDGLGMGSPIDRERLVLPEVAVEELPCDVMSLLKPMFDALWQACGRDRSQFYNPDGSPKWKI